MMKLEKERQKTRHTGRRQGRERRGNRRGKKYISQEERRREEGSECRWEFENSDGYKAGKCQEKKEPRKKTKTEKAAVP
jgi:hypothetical protein